MCLSVMLILFCRLNNADKKKNKIFASLKKNERDKKKLLDTVLKQLRSLVNGSTQHVQGWLTGENVIRSILCHVNTTQKDLVECDKHSVSY